MSAATLKTPAEIASDTYWAKSLPDTPTGAELRAVIEAAIEADRAQRQRQALEALREFDEKYPEKAKVTHSEIYIAQNDAGEVVGVFRDPDEATAFFQDGYSIIEESVSEPGELADARIAELTAAWEESTGDTASDYSLSKDDWAAGLGEDDAREIARLIEWRDA